MKIEDLKRLQHVLAEAESIIQESLSQKKTVQDIALHKALLKLRMKVQKMMAARKQPSKP